jgi:hypothetical protein
MSEEKSKSMMESVVTDGDLSLLSKADRLTYYNKVCESLGLNPLTKPFQYILLDGANNQKRLTLYATKDCTEQLRKINGISVTIVAREFQGDLYIVTARATDKTGRVDESIGAVSFKSSKYDKSTNKRVYYDAQGDARANLLMKAETKAKRRVTLSISGLGMLDETEADSIQSALLVPEVEVDLLTKNKEELIHELYRLISDHSVQEDVQSKWLEWGGVNNFEELSFDNLSKLILKVRQKYESLEVKNGD